MKALKVLLNQAKVLGEARRQITTLTEQLDKAAEKNLLETLKKLTDSEKDLAKFGGHTDECPAGKPYAGPYSGIPRCDPKVCGWDEVSKEAKCSSISG